MEKTSFSYVFTTFEFRNTIQSNTLYQIRGEIQNELNRIEEEEQQKYPTDPL